METEDAIEDASECEVKASSIKAIDKKSVHRICSGQVVLTLATAVKELVENSIDAGATSVEVRLKDYGCESIEVIDNGSGVKEENFEGLALKHHTSKLTDFEDLVHVETFGFRGEALSSLCALSNMVITTRHKSVSVGTRLEFNMNGKIISKKIIPKPVGTVVALQNIFHTLPVRHKEFQRNLKKEFARLIQVLNAYCVINTGVRISCINQTSKGNRTTVISTNCNTSMKDNISNVFGSKQLHSLLEFKQISPKEETCLEYGVKMPQNSIDFSISGYISKCEHGQGRSSTDRQFIFINKRPCDATKILKLINEVYHMYNRHQYPLISLSIEMKKESVDVNVTPDKRQMFLDGEKLLLAVLKTSLIELFEPTSSVYKMNNTCFTGDKTPKIVDKPSVSKSDATRTSLSSSLSTPAVLGGCQEMKISLSDSLTKLKRNFSSAFDKGKESPSLPDVLKRTNKKSKSVLSSSFSSFSRTLTDESSDKSSILNFFTPKSGKKSVDGYGNQKNSLDLTEQHAEISGDRYANINEIKTLKVVEEHHSQTDSDIICANIDFVQEDIEGIKDSGQICQLENKYETVVECLEKESDHLDKKEASDNCQSVKVEDAEDFHLDNNMNKNFKNEEADQSVISFMKNDNVNKAKPGLSQEDKNVEEQGFTRSKKEAVLNFSLDNLRNRLRKKSKINDTSPAASFSRAFRAKISPSDQKEAEEELQREISKDMFSKMQILGQFNLGFIIARLGNDLFIIDQHATDEKYNFETLQKNHVLQSQKMIVPQNLELTSSNEIILIDNMEVFKKNGFDFLIEPEAPPTQRVKLISAPVSKNWTFGKDDIEELLFMLMDSPNVMCRPSRVRMMFASRACRKSIMIGTALNHNEMKRLVTHMGEIEQPWNCPHGRPTMRHLFNLNMLPS